RADRLAAARGVKQRAPRLAGPPGEELQDQFFQRYPRAASAVGLLMASGCVKGKRHGGPISEPTTSAGKTKAGALNSVAPATLGLIEGHVGPVHHPFDARSLGVPEADSGAGRACQRTNIGLQAHGREI